MSQNTNSSEENSSALVNERKLDIKPSDQNQQNQDLSDKIALNLKYITITKHLCEPCPGIYIDILNVAQIICKDPSHEQDYHSNKDKSYQKTTYQANSINQCCDPIVSRKN